VKNPEPHIFKQLQIPPVPWQYMLSLMSFNYQ